MFRERSERATKYTSNQKIQLFSASWSGTLVSERQAYYPAKKDNFQGKVPLWTVFLVQWLFSLNFLDHWSIENHFLLFPPDFDKITSCRSAAVAGKRMTTLAQIPGIICKLVYLPLLSCYFTSFNDSCYDEVSFVRIRLSTGRFHRYASICSLKIT